MVEQAVVTPSPQDALRKRIESVERSAVLLSARPPKGGENAVGAARRAARILRSLGHGLGETCRDFDVPKGFELGILGEQTLEILERLLEGKPALRHDHRRHRWGPTCLQLVDGDLIDAETKAVPWKLTELDTGLAPRRGAEQPIGQATLTVREGWTALAAWDRSVDTRPNSNIVWLLPGEWGFDEAVERIAATMPERWALFYNQTGWPEGQKLLHVVRDPAGKVA